MRRFKRLVFALIPTVVLFGLATLVLWGLDVTGIWTAVSANRAPVDDEGRTIVRKWTPTGYDWVIQDASTMLHQRFPVEKKPGVFRFVILGESFAMGCPYVQQSHPDGFGGIGDWLRAELARRYPSRTFEFINLATGGANTTHVRNVFEQALDTHPDLMILATGNNEGVVPKTPVNQALKEWVVYRAMRAKITDLMAAYDRPVFTPQDPDTRAIVDLFHKNVLAMLDAAGAADAPLVVATLPVNYRFRGPTRLASGRSTDLFPASDPDFDAGLNLAAKHDCVGAAQAYARSPHQAYAARLAGQCFDQIGDYEKALDYYRVYLELLPLNRIRPSFNDFVGGLARERGIPLADLERAARLASPTGITPPELFVDFCHMTWQGYYQMAQVVADTIIDAGLIPAQPGEPLPRPDFDQLLTPEERRALDRSIAAVRLPDI